MHLYGGFSPLENSSFVPCVISAPLASNGVLISPRGLHYMIANSASSITQGPGVLLHCCWHVLRGLGAGLRDRGDVLGAMEGSWQVPGGFRGGREEEGSGGVLRQLELLRGSADL